MRGSVADFEVAGRSLSTNTEATPNSTQNDTKTVEAKERASPKERRESQKTKQSSKATVGDAAGGAIDNATARALKCMW